MALTSITKAIRSIRSGSALGPARARRSWPSSSRAARTPTHGPAGWVGSGGAAEGQRARWGRGGRALHDAWLPDFLAEGCRAPAGLLPRLQRLAGDVLQLCAQ